MPKQRESRIGLIEPGIYFAYGSNMCTARLRARMPSCEPLGTATLLGHALRFHKRSKDGSGKCNALATGGCDKVIGVLFSFDPTERGRLDRAEGLGNGYDHAAVTVIDCEGRDHHVLTYIATADQIDETLKPYGWYKDLVAEGAREHGLPADYRAMFIDPVASMEDPSTTRDSNERAVLSRLRPS